MNVTRSIVGALAAGGLVLGLGSAASACPNDWEDDDLWYDEGNLELDQEDEFEANHGSAVHGYNASHWSTVNAPRTTTVNDDDTAWSGVIVNSFD